MIWRCGNRDDDKRPNDCGCGDNCPRVEGLTPEEFDLVAKAFIERLGSAMSRAGCNDLFPDEFPESVCARFDNDYSVLSAFEQAMGYRE